MLIVRLVVSLSVTAMFTYGATSLFTTSAPAARTSTKRTATSSGEPCAPAPATVPRHVGTIILGREAHSDNCVLYARARVPSLPYGLGTWKGKLAIINAHAPQPGDVAVIQVGSGVYKDVGHVAIVEAVTDSTIIILEGNFYAGYVSRRTATGANAGEAAGLMGVVGYFRPSGKAAGQNKTSSTKKLAAES